MSNIGVNQLVVFGNRKHIFDLFSNIDLNYANHDIHEINNNQFCVMFNKQLDRSIKFIKKLSKKNPDLKFTLFYADKLLSNARIITIQNQDIHTKKQNLKLTLKEMQQDLLFETAFKELL